MNALPPILEEHMSEIRALCEKYRVKRLAVFGSAAKGTFDAARSDVDFVVEYFPSEDPVERGQASLEFWRALERVVERRVDLVNRASVRNPYFSEILTDTARELYAA